MEGKQAYKRQEINSIIEQLKTIKLHGDPVFSIHQEDGLRSVNVLLTLHPYSLGYSRWIDFMLDPSEPETEPARRARTTTD